MLYPKYYFSDEFADFEAVFKKHGAKPLSFKKGDRLKGPAQYLDSCYYVRNGYCSVTIWHDSGNERLVGFWGPGSIYPLITSENHYFLETALDVKAIVDMEVLSLDVACVKASIEDDPRIAFAAIDHYGAYTNLLKFEAAAQSYEDALMRVCNILYIRYDSFLEDSVRLTQQDIASMAGLRRESVVKVLRHLRNEGIVSTHGGLAIQDPDRLLSLCSDMLQAG